MHFQLMRIVRFVFAVWLLSTFFSVYWVVVHVSVIDKDNNPSAETWPGNQQQQQQQQQQPGILDRMAALMALSYAARKAKKTPPSSRLTRPAASRKRGVYPAPNHAFDGRVHDRDEDRILEQLDFTPPSVLRQRKTSKRRPVKTKKIFSVPNFIMGQSSNSKRESDRFREDCALPCEFVDRADEADVLVVKTANFLPERRPRHQIWVLYALESPAFNSLTWTIGSRSGGGARGMFNWTATYRHDSTIVAPYEKYVPVVGASSSASASSFPALLTRRSPARNYAAGKTKKVAWFVSNCAAANKRLEYAQDLAQYIQVDIYGLCGDLECKRSKTECFKMLDTDYKFYLAFENSNCRDYITEKFFVNGLQHDVVPIVMGAAPEDYERVAPPNSYIHVDDFWGPRDLAAYLHKLDQDDELYNQYFLWKGLWHNINTFFWCRLCNLAHDAEDQEPRWYEDIVAWWERPGICSDKPSWALEGQQAANKTVV